MLPRSIAATAVNPEFPPRHNEPAAAAAMLLDRLERRRSIYPMHLAEPGPSSDEHHCILALAARVPDHGALTPWRFIVAAGDARTRIVQRLSDVCLATASIHDAHSVAQAQNTARKFSVLFGRSPLIVIFVMRPDLAASIPVREQVLSADAACMNLITAATVLGFGANWRTGWTATHHSARPVLGLAGGEAIAGITPIGTATEPPLDCPRPDFARIAISWTD